MTSTHTRSAQLHFIQVRQLASDLPVTQEEALASTDQGMFFIIPGVLLPHRRAFIGTVNVPHTEVVGKKLCSHRNRAS